jgi:hypothetical protein
MKKRLSLWLAVIFAAFHFVAIGGTILESGGGGEGLAFALVGYDWVLLWLCAHSVLGRYLCSYTTPRGWVIYLLAGTLIYAIAGFAIGAVIDSVRALIRRRRGQS